MESALPWMVMALVLVAVTVVVVLKMPKGKVAVIEVRPGEPFDLHCAPADDRPYKVWTRYRVAFTGTSRNGNDYVRAGTFLLAQSKSRAMGAPIEVRGVIRPAEGAAVKLLRVYIAS